MGPFSVSAWEDFLATMEMPRRWDHVSQGVRAVTAIESALASVGEEGHAPQACGLEFFGPADLAGPCTLVLSYNLSVDERDLLVGILNSLSSDLRAEPSSS